jgi:hypothetical protein
MLSKIYISTNLLWKGRKEGREGWMDGGREREREERREGGRVEKINEKIEKGKKKIWSKSCTFIARFGVDLEL